MSTPVYLHDVVPNKSLWGQSMVHDNLADANKEIAQLRADLARVTGERDDWKKLANKYMDKCAVMLSEKMDQPTPPTGG